MPADDETTFSAAVQRSEQYLAKWWIKEGNKKAVAYSDPKPFATMEAAVGHIHERARSKGHQKVRWDAHEFVWKPGEVSDVPNLDTKG